MAIYIISNSANHAQYEKINEVVPFPASRAASYAGKWGCAEADVKYYQVTNQTDLDNLADTSMLWEPLWSGLTITGINWAVEDGARYIVGFARVSGKEYESGTKTIILSGAETVTLRAFIYNSVNGLPTTQTNIAGTYSIPIDIPGVGVQDLPITFSGGQATLTAIAATTDRAKAGTYQFPAPSQLRTAPGGQKYKTVRTDQLGYVRLIRLVDLATI